METILIIACIVAILFSIFKVIESKVIDKRFPPVKYIIRDGCIAFASAFIGLFGYVQINGSFTDLMNIITDNKSPNLSATQVFTDDPGF
jgi:hypothetical protein|tara:strand:- start:255 stop:521 length:267 start_codon:yes stop_codon:yes gene_type:complete